MPALDATSIADGALAFIRFFKFQNKTRGSLAIIGAALALYYLKRRLQSNKSNLKDLEKEADLFVKKGPSKPKGAVDKNFLKKLLKFLRIAIPGWKSRETGYILGLSIALVVRTILSIRLAEVNGGVVHGIIQRNKDKFVQGLFTILLYAVPSSIINSLLEYLMVMIALFFRENLTKHYHERYINDKFFYQICNLDDRIMNPDQRLTVDIQKWAISLSNLYSNFSKPLLDIVLFSKRLYGVVGGYGVALPF